MLITFADLHDLREGWPADSCSSRSGLNSGDLLGVKLHDGQGDDETTDVRMVGIWWKPPSLPFIFNL